MDKQAHSDWDPRSEEVMRDQRTAYDELRERCPVAHSGLMHWSLFRHEDLKRVLDDHETFSNAVSQHLSVPNGMDPPEHTEYRRIIEPYFSPEPMEAFEPRCRKTARELVDGLLDRGRVEWMADFALPFAVRAQCEFLGWPPSYHQPLIEWTRKNFEATFAQDGKAMSDIAREFEQFIDEMLDAREQSGARPEDDVTAALMHEQVWGRPLSNEEIASILRNWTVGEVGTISASTGILAHYLSEHGELQQQLRRDPSLIPPAIEEILRVDGPLVANRRVTTCPVEIGGRKLDAGERVSLIWISANRDGQAFEAADEVRLDRDQSENLLWGAGIHVCPGAPLARLELRVVLEELLGRSETLERRSEAKPARAVYPSSGFSSLPLRIQ